MAQDHKAVLQFVTDYAQAGLPFSAISTLIVSYAILIPITLVLGGMIGWISDENQRLKLFALGISAPALLTTWASNPPGSPPTNGEAYFSPISSAYAQNPFGESSEQAYVVQVGSFEDRNNADALVKQINDRNNAARAFIAEFNNSGITTYRVQVTLLLSLKNALSLRERLIRQGLTQEATIVPATPDDP